MAKPITMAVSTRACGIGSSYCSSVASSPGVSTGSLSTESRPMAKMNRLTP